MADGWLIEIDCNPGHAATRWGAEIRDPNGDVHQTIEAPTARELCDELAAVLDPAAEEEEYQRLVREGDYEARQHIVATIEVARRNLKRMLPNEPFSDDLSVRIVRHLRLARDLGRRNPKFIELADELKSVIDEEGTA